MGVYPTGYNKEEFIVFLQNNNTNETIINKFKILPENVKHNNHIYKLNIVSTFISVGMFCNFELNYYSEDQIEFLFPYKIFGNVEESIDNILCDLIEGKYINKPDFCNFCK
jgi:hypothetical protein